MKTQGPEIQSAAVPSLIRVIGCGNAAAADDGVGIELVRRLQAGTHLPGQRPCNFSVVLSVGTELLDLMDSGQPIVFVDAVMGGSVPGTLHLIPLPSREIETRPISSLSSHGWGLLETLELAQQLKPHLPPMLLLGIELGSLEPLGAPTAEVNRVMARVAACFPRLLDSLRDPTAKLWHEPQRFLPAQPLPWEEPCA